MPPLQRGPRVDDGPEPSKQETHAMFGIGYGYQDFKPNRDDPKTSGQIGMGTSGEGGIPTRRAAVQSGGGIASVERRRRPARAMAAGTAAARAAAAAAARPPIRMAGAAGTATRSSIWRGTARTHCDPEGRAVDSTAVDPAAGARTRRAPEERRRRPLQHTNAALHRGREAS